MQFIIYLRLFHHSPSSSVVIHLAFPFLARVARVSPRPPPFLLPQVFYFPPKFVLSCSWLVAEVWSLVWTTKGTEEPEDFMATALFSLAALERVEAMRIHTIVVLAPCTLWSSGLTPGPCQHHSYISTSRSWDQSTRFSWHLSTKVRGFHKHITRKKLSQFILFALVKCVFKPSQKGLSVSLFNDISSRSCSLCSIHLMCEV